MTEPWSGPRPYVSRTVVHEALARELDSMMEGGGRAVFLLGPEGSGQSTTLAIFQEEAHRRHRGLKAEYVDCAYSGAKTWAELAEIFTRGHRLKRSLGKVAADWLESIPVIGKVGQAVVRSVQTIRGGPGAGSRREAPTTSAHDSAMAAVRLLMEYEPREPRLIIMDSLDRGDSEDLAGAAALIRRLPDTRTLFLAALRTTDGRAPKVIGDLILEAERLGRALRLEVPPLTREELEQVLTGATGGAPASEWLDWLMVQSRGNFHELWASLGRLEQTGSLRPSGWRWSWKGSPPSAAAAEHGARPSRAWELDEQELRLVVLAACEGREFHSAVLAELAELDELEVEDRLSRLCRVGLFEYRDAPAAGTEVTSRYVFKSPADQAYFASTLQEEERARRSGEAEAIRQRLGL